MSGPNETAFPDISDSVSVKSIMSSNAGGKAFPDIWISAYMEGTPKKKFFKAKLDTGADLCLISEHVVANKWGLERIDSTKRVTLNSLGMSGILTMGRIRVTIRLGSKIKETNVPFHVVPNSCVQHRFDALLSDSLIKRRKILVPGPGYPDEDTESEDDE
jgi:hypothetical protein